ncbi:hypothetical protein PGB90_000728 [Kerria lacca]
MLINRWKKDKEKDKSSASSQNVSGHASVGYINSNSSSKTSLGSAKKKRKAGKEGKKKMYEKNMAKNVVT